MPGLARARVHARDVPKCRQRTDLSLAGIAGSGGYLPSRYPRNYTPLPFSPVWLGEYPQIPAIPADCPSIPLHFENTKRTCGRMIESPATLAELRMLVAVKLAVAPRRLFVTLAKPKATPDECDRARQELVEFVTRDLARWQFIRVVDEATLRGHSGSACHDG